MKTPRLIVLFTYMILISGSSHADGKSHQINQQPPLNGALSGHKPLPEAKPSNQPPRTASHLPSVIARNPRRSLAGTSSTVKGAAIQNPIAARGRPRPLSAAAPLLTNARHRSPNPAVISGTAYLSTRNTGAIDGRKVYRRP
jgi:hypothetical protein